MEIELYPLVKLHSQHCVYDVRDPLAAEMHGPSFPVKRVFWQLEALG